LKFHTSDGKSSEKAGGFTLEKIYGFQGKEVGKIVYQAMRDGTDACTRLEFYDRAGAIIIMMNGSSSLGGVEKTFTIDAD